MVCGVKRIDMNTTVISWRLRTFANRIWCVVAGIDKKQHRYDAEEGKKTKHLQFTISFVYFNRYDEKKSQLEIFWTVEVSRFCTIHAVTNEKKSNVI
jgi:hypothetical protein